MARSRERLTPELRRDGTRSGFDLYLTATIAARVTVPLIASGGADSPSDFLDVFEQGHADAALAASIFHDAVQGLRELKYFLDSKGVPVRLSG